MFSKKHESKGSWFFAEELTWKFLNKHNYNPVEIDVNLDSLSGDYTGQIRGQTISIEVKALSNSIAISSAGQSKVDTLIIYIGDNTGRDGND